jgi:hypothetical protein
MIGALVEVEITQAFKHSLHGVLDQAALAGLPALAEGAVAPPERRRRSLTMVS